LLCCGAARRRDFWEVVVGDGENLVTLFSRVRAGDQQATTEFVRRYEPSLRRMVRLKLRDRKLRRLFDSADVGQAVLVRFLVRVTDGAYDCNTPEQILQLLGVMARRQLVNLALREQALKRDCRRRAEVPADECPVAARGSSPSQRAAARELMDRAHQLLTPDEQRLLELRQQGHPWDVIAQLVPGTPEALRKQLARAVERVTTALGLDGVRHV
jgi:RNA polymerase sigma-70 factor (ECF subfamily)